MEMSRYLKHGLLSIALALAVCSGAWAQTLSLPEKLAGKAAVLQSNDPDYARAKADSAVKPEGMGGIAAVLVVRITEDIPVYRMWSGPDKKDARGNTNRLGGWWSYDKPIGLVAKYRSDYEICQAWNDLTWMADCTLKKGAVVAIGPGQSVSAETCGDPTGKESYGPDSANWQVYVDKPWSRPDEIACPPESADYAANPEDISRAR
jgi:hypothetical protein